MTTDAIMRWENEGGAVLAVAVEPSRRQRAGDGETSVVVGVDGSEGAKAALRFALDEARLRDATLRFVHT